MEKTWAVQENYWNWTENGFALHINDRFHKKHFVLKMSSFTFCQLIMFVNMQNLTLLFSPFKRYQKIKLSVKKVVNKPRKRTK